MDSMDNSKTQRIRLLMVEDDLVDRMAFERLVKQESLPYDYTCVGSVAEGIQALERSAFDVIVTDYRLGDGTAFDFMVAVNSDTPVVLVTGAGGEEVAVQAMKRGASDYLIKDVDGNYLKTLPLTVGNTIKAKKTELELARYHAELEMLVKERTEQLEDKNKELVTEIEERRKADEALTLAHGELKRAHDKLEIRVERRTYELRRSNEQLLQEIGERRKIEESLRKSMETTEAVLNATTDSVCLLDSEGKFLSLNEPAAQRAEAPIGSLLGRSYFATIPPELVNLRKARFNEVLNKGTAVRFEDSTRGRVMDTSIHPVFDALGSVDRVAVFTREVTEQKKAQELIVQKQRVAALGEMAGGVAHNFNNLLQIIVGACGAAQIELEFGDVKAAKATLGKVVDSAQAGSQTVKQLQDFAGVRTEDPSLDGRVFDLSDVVSRAIDMTRPLRASASRKGGRYDVKKDLAPACIVKGKQNELFEVVVNLIKNSVEAMPTGGWIMITTRLDREHVVLTISDNGPGISKEHSSKVFEPFWTTKGLKGTGMGLSTAMGVVTRHEGSIQIDHTAQQGAKFIIRLPKAVEDDKARHSPILSSMDFKAKILLLVHLRAVITELEVGLRQYGHDVFKASSGWEGLELYKKEGAEIIICDLGMRDLNGWQISRAIKDLCAKREVPKPPFVLRAGGMEMLGDDPRIEECGVDRIIARTLDLPGNLKLVRELVMAYREESR
jgi:C4-dicarboxylate-specific signal transduction histidine kinase